MMTVAMADSDTDAAGRRYPSTRVLIGSAVVGFVGVALVIIGAAQSASPFTSKLVGSWFYGIPTSSHGLAATSSSVAAQFGLVSVYAGIVLVLCSWYCIVLVCTNSARVPVKHLVAILGAWTAPVLVGPPLFSRDVYAYAAQAQMVAHGINPYTHGPSSLGSSSFLSLVDKLWEHAHSPYGPLFFDAARLDTYFAGRNVLATVVGFRALALLGVVLIAVAVPSIARSFGKSPSTAFALALLNPLLIFDLIGGAHNDSLMLGLLVSGYALARLRHPVVGMALCALGAAIKLPAFIGVVYIGWAWAGSASSNRRRLGFVAMSVAIGGAIMAALSAVSGLGWGWLSNTSAPGTVVSWLDPATAIGLALSHLAQALGSGNHAHFLVTAARAAGLLVAAGVSIYLLVSSDRLGAARSMGWSLLAFAVLGPIVWPWYEVWGLAILAIMAAGWERRVIFALSGLACIADFPSASSLHGVNPLAVIGLVAIVAAVAALGVIHARRTLVPRRDLAHADQSSRRCGRVPVS